jgi:hypothetical protein
MTYRKNKFSTHEIVRKDQDIHAVFDISLVTAKATAIL